MNAIYFTPYILIFWRYIVPVRRLIALVQMAHQALHPHTPPMAACTSPAKLPHALSKLASCAAEQARLRADLHHELDTARQILEDFSAQHQQILRCTSEEIVAQYQHILSYAHYLDTHIAHHTNDDHLRYHFDDVCESGFNLKLIAGALDLLRQNAPAARHSVHLADLMQNTLLALASSLDRRSMKLMTSAVDLNVVATTDSGIVVHALWMLLLGTIRYAEAESTLQMRCHYNAAGTHAFIGVEVSELSPGQMTPDERATHFERQMTHATPHMFAATIRDHANITLANLLLKKIGARVDVAPLSNYSCEICIELPLE